MILSWTDQFPERAALVKATRKRVRELKDEDAAAVGHRVAEASVHRFVHAVVETLRHDVSG